jgi:hypothetical protein
MNERLIREWIHALILLEQPASAAMKRAVKSKSALPAAEIIIKNSSSETPDPWFQKSAAGVHSNAIDLVLSNGIDDVNVEIKDYGSTTEFKAEISLAGNSALAKLLGLSSEAFTAGDDVLNRIKDPTTEELEKNSELMSFAEIESNIANLISQPGTSREIIGAAIVDTKGKRAPRYISLMGGAPNDYQRIRHSSDPTSHPRKLYTAPTSAVRGAASVSEGDPAIFNELAAAISSDFAEDQYLALFDGSTLRVFTLKGSDPLDLGAPPLDGMSIEKWRFATHGGEVRPAVFITVQSNSGRVLTLGAQAMEKLAAGNMRALRNLIQETLLFEELTKSDKKEIEKIARKQAKKEIDKAVGTNFAKTIQDEVKKILKDKATKQEIGDISKAVMKKLYKDLAMSSPQIIDRIKV